MWIAGNLTTRHCNAVKIAIAATPKRFRCNAESLCDSLRINAHARYLTLAPALIHTSDAGRNHPGVDTIGVSVAYDYTWHTPLKSLLGWTGNGVNFVRSNAMRMEPIL